MDYANVKTWLERTSRTGSSNHSWLNDVISQLTADRRELIQFIKYFLASPSLLALAAATSYKHMNNFDKIVLLEFGVPPCKLRLHIWKDQVNEQRENIHDHRWNFASKILLGHYRFQIFAEKGTNQFYEYLYQSPGGREHYNLSAGKPIMLDCVLDTVMTAGTSYFLSHQVLHRVVADAGMVTVSLMCQGPPVKMAARVISDCNIVNINSIPAEHYRPEELAQKLNEVCELLNNSAQITESQLHSSTFSKRYT